MIEVTVVHGDMTHTETDCIVTRLDPGPSHWDGAVESAIRGCGGAFFYERMRGGSFILDGGVKSHISTTADQMGVFSGSFQMALFVEDRMDQPLERFIQDCLRMAASYGRLTISVPLMRTGRSCGIVEQTPLEAIRSQVLGVEEFVSSRGRGGYTIDMLLREIRLCTLNETFADYARSVLLI